ncbi:MAG: type I DNA topoisomerase [Planctomycetota bacterium]
MANKKVKGLVIVESPAKAKKINSFLGSDYTVLASMGHVCDLPQGADQIPDDVKKAQPWTKLGVNVDNDFEPYYVVPKEKEKTVRELKAALKLADDLIIATDEDREGESIGWHLKRLLDPQSKLPVKRMVFSEITKEAIQEAIANPRTIDENLVAAQETRRVVDRLYGYTLSPLLWKKIAPKLSAGRVQSVAVRLLVTRELERLAFKKGTYWDLKAQLETAEKAKFTAELATVSGRKVAAGKDFDETTGRLKADADVLLLDETTARSLQERLQTGPWQVASLEQRQQVRRPYPPFTTSTLQQEANRKLGLSARETMQIAQRLYEDGYITYMRTDSVHLSNEAITASRGCVKDRYGDAYLSPEPRQYTTKSKGAQEAHEAIRPAGTEMKTADELGLGAREARLYSLIWMRTVASQMAEARLQFMTAVISVGDAEFRATGRHVEFPGFFRAYVEGVDDPEAALDDQEAALPPLKEKEKLGCTQLDSVGHETKPPARFTEATLVRTLEAEGIGRPSTYASIISTIQDRNYAVKTGNQLIPTFTAMAVTKLLETHFPQLVDLAFTAKMEQTLDDIALGEAERLPYLKAFFSDVNGLENQVKQHEEEIDPRTACTLEFEGLTSKIRIGRFGAYAERQDGEETLKASLPADLTPADISNEIVEDLILRKQQGPQALGEDPETGKPIYVMTGPYGTYLQLGQVVDGEPKPKRVSVPKNIPMHDLTFQTAVDLINLPRSLGKHPETGKVVNAGVGMYGPYVLHDKKYKAIPKEQSVLTITMDQAVELLKQVKGRAAATPLKELGNHPTDGQPISIFEGRYGPYVKHGDNNATIPKEKEIEQVTMDEALSWLAERLAKGPAKKKGRGAKKSVASAAKKTDAPKKKAATKKAAAKKTAKTVTE